MLSNAYFLAKFRFDTAENEPAKNLQNLLIFPILLTLTPNPSVQQPRRRAHYLAKLVNLAFFLQTFANFWRAHSRLYQNEILQENMRLTAFFELYKICILLHRCNLEIFAKDRFEKSANFVKIQQHFCKCRKICKFCQISKESAR